jgi:transposase
MRPLKSHFPANALPPVETVLKQTQEARVFRRAQAVREVVAGPHVHTVAATFHVATSARRKGVQRFAQEGPQGWLDRPRSGRPPKVTCALAQPRNRLVDQDPLQHGSRSSPWRGRELAMVLAQQTGIQLGRERVRGVVNNTREVTAVLLDGSILPRLISPLALLNSPLWSTEHGEVRSSGAMQMQRSCGAWPCPGWAGGAAPSVIACPHAR